MQRTNGMENFISHSYTRLHFYYLDYVKLNMGEFQSAAIGKRNIKIKQKLCKIITLLQVLHVFPSNVYRSG